MVVRSAVGLPVGGGQMGIAMSEPLDQAEVLHVVLERHRIAERWRSERCPHGRRRPDRRPHGRLLLYPWSLQAATRRSCLRGQPSGDLHLGAGNRARLIDASIARRAL